MTCMQSVHLPFPDVVPPGLGCLHHPGGCDQTKCSTPGKISAGSLTASEYATTVLTLKEAGKLSPSTLFPLIMLNEPPKSEVLAFPGRKAFSSGGVRRAPGSGKQQDP